MKTLASLSLGLFLLSGFSLPADAANLLCGSKASLQSARCKALTSTEEKKIGTAWSSERSGFGRFE